MGLDMYLFKTKKVNGFSVDDYFKVDQFVDEYINSESQLNNLDLEKVLDLKGANELIPCIKEHGECIKWFSIFEKIGYWRKANQIHKWFVDNVQGGEDECEPHIVSKEQLEILLDTVNLILKLEPYLDPETKVLEGKAKRLAEKALPTQAGFFFGSTEYDDYYFFQLLETKEIIKNVLSETDFDNEIVIYQSSW